MNRKLTAIISLVLVGGLVATAEEVRWTGAGADDSWSTAGNWDGGRVPGTYDVIVLNPPPLAAMRRSGQRGPVITSDIECGEIRGPVWKSGDPQVVDVISCNVAINGWWRFANKRSGAGTINIKRANVDIGGMFRMSDGGRTYGVANITDSVVKCKGVLIGDGGNGEINMSGNVLFEVEDTVNMGGSPGDNPRRYEDKPLRITMNGGIFHIGGRLMCPSDKDRAGTASIKLTAGTLQCKTFSHADVAYSMDIEQGVFSIDGDVRAEMEQDIKSGYITAYNGKAKVQCSYDGDKNQTVVMSSVQKKAWRPYPANRADEVLPGTIVKCNPAQNAQTHNVYLGTSLEAVKPDAAAYLKDQRGAEFKPTLAFGKTYFWRVDTVDSNGLTGTGATWQFTTTDGKTTKPSPHDNAAEVPVDVTLSWKLGLVATSHNVYLGTDYEKVKNATDPGKLRVGGSLHLNTFRPRRLELGRTYYWRVDAVNERWIESPWKGDVCSFTVDKGKARNPQPMDKRQWTPTNVTLNWKPAKTAISHNIYFAQDLHAVKRGIALVAAGQKPTTHAVGPIQQASTYYWRVDEVHGSGEVVVGDTWQFTTEGALELKVDLAVPQWENRKKPRPGTAKPGWVIWASERWADMYMHNPVWFPSDDSGNSPNKNGILGSGVCARIFNGGGGNGAVHTRGLCRGGLAGDLPPYGKPEGDPIANTYFYACDWAGPKQGDALLMLTGLPAGEYELLSYHNHWEPCEQQTRNCHNCDSGMPPMPSVTANPFPPKPLPGYKNWSVPAGSGTGVTAIKNAKNVKVSSVYSDDEVSRSLIRFATDGSGVLVIYEADKTEPLYPDRARSGREGARGILNAFELRLVSWSKERR